MFSAYLTVSKYEAMLMEMGGPGPTEDKMILVFQTLDKLIPNLGVFTRVMELCRGQLFGKCCGPPILPEDNLILP